jgi:tetratricopeptide (TPR) repeat protein
MDGRLRKARGFQVLSNRVWQLGLVELGTLITEEESLPFSPIFPLLAIDAPPTVIPGEVMHPADASADAALDHILEFATTSSEGGYLPHILQVNDSSIRDPLAQILEPLGVHVAYVPRLDMVDAALEELTEHLQQEHALPGPLDGDDVTPIRLSRFYEAALEFHAAKPWRYLTDGDLLKIVKPKPYRGMGYAVVMGAGGIAQGLALYPSVSDFGRSRCEAGQSADALYGFFQVSFDPPELLPEDAKVFESMGLSLTSNGLLPLMFGTDDYGELIRPNAVQLAYAEGVLRALSIVEEKEIDSGRWASSVRRNGRLVNHQIELPDLLNPPTFGEWYERGYEPDRRAMESSLAGLASFINENPDSIGKDGRVDFDPSDIPEYEPKTTLEKAQALCYQAFDTYGRGRVLLARKALEICPDCADAYVILAEQAAFDETLSLYREGLAAGERSLGPEGIEEYEGMFWGAIPTRPYMRAKFGLAATLEQLGRSKEASDHYRALLDLNPGDNQGVRYLLLPLLLKLNEDREAAALLDAYDEDSAQWAYIRVLLAYRLSDEPGTAARRELRKATEVNPYVPDLLVMGTDHIPNSPTSYTLGSIEEAIICAEETKDAFLKTPEFLDWLSEEIQHRDRLNSERTDARLERKKKSQQKKKNQQKRRK